MSKVIVVSDSHYLTEDLLNLYQHYKNNNSFFIHCGDSELEEDHQLLKIYKTVKGNCDFSSFKDYDLINVDGKRILFTHGHQFSVKFNLNRLYYFGLENKADIICFGHTHRPMIKTISDVLFVNPGSIKHNRGFGIKVQTYAVIDIQNESINVKHYDIKNFKEISI